MSPPPLPLRASWASPLLLILVACLASPTEDDEALPDDDASSDDDTSPDDDTGPDDDATPDDDTSTGEDADGDGFSPPEDCDDGNATIHPGQKEACGDGIDNNCDGHANECRYQGEVPLSEAWATIEGKSNGAEVGTSLFARDLTGDSNADLIIGAPYEGVVEALSSGAAYVMTWPMDSGYQSVDEAPLLLRGPPIEALGYLPGAGASVGAGDLDGDGIFDLAVGSPNGGLLLAGVVHLVYGPISSGEYDLGVEGEEIHGPFAGTFAGATLAFGSFTWDGGQDLLVGAPGDRFLGSELESYSGVFSFYAPDASPGDVEDADAEVHAETDYVQAGAALISGWDMDGNGLDEAMIGAPGASYTGSAFLYQGRIPEGSSPLRWADVEFTGSEETNGFGCALAAGDFDGGGEVDVAVADCNYSHYDYRGAVQVFFAPFPSGSYSPGEDSLTIEGVEEGASEYGMSILSWGDSDGDGTDDLLVGLQAAGAPDFHGAVYLFYGPLSAGARDLDSADAVFRGDAGDRLGAALSWADDMTGSGGNEDFALGAPGAVGGGGAVYIMESRGM